MIYLHKILPFLLSPLGIIFIFLIASFFLKRRFFVFLAFLVLVISSNPIVGNYLIQKLEYPYKPISMNSLKEADAIVVLSSGATRKVGEDSNTRYEIVNASRFFSGVDLLKNNKADLLIFTAGQVPWSANRRPEGVVLREKAISFGISQTKIMVTQKVKNTFEESLAVKKLIPNNSSIILITSAFHMDRSKYLFEKQGFEVTPFPVDFRSSISDISIFSFLPSLGAMNNVSRFIRENIGRIYYKFFIN